MKILFIGDIVSSPGKRVISQVLEPVLEEKKIDLCVANGENVAGGRGITRNLFEKLKRMGIQVVTSGNHIWNNRDIYPLLTEGSEVLRPHNYPSGNPGTGSTLFTLENGVPVGIINIQGRVFMEPIECPFRAALEEANKLNGQTSVILVDFHAEATSEKIAMGWYLDGKVSAVIGTHTHVQTADEQVLPGGTAYISDAGMTGAADSVIGVKKELAIRKFLLQAPVRFEPADGGLIFNAVVIDVDENTGKANGIERIYKRL